MNYDSDDIDHNNNSSRDFATTYFRVRDKNENSSDKIVTINGKYDDMMIYLRNQRYQCNCKNIMSKNLMVAMPEWSH